MKNQDAFGRNVVLGLVGGLLVAVANVAHQILSW